MSIKQFISGIFRPAAPKAGLHKTNTPGFDAFVYLWKHSYGKEALNTGCKLHFSKYFGFDSHMTHVLKLTGKPAFTMENRSMDLNILVYLQKVKGNDLRFELHFHKDKLFFINYTYYNMSDLEKEHVIHSLCEKHQVNATSPVYEHIIIDQEGNGLLFENNEHFSVNYLAPSSKVESITQSYLLDKRRVV